MRLWHECYALLAKRRGLSLTMASLGLRQRKPTQLPQEISSTEQITQRRGFHSVPYFHLPMFLEHCVGKIVLEKEASPVRRLSNGAFRLWALWLGAYEVRERIIQAEM